jgi:hypothetical protein
MTTAGVEGSSFGTYGFDGVVSPRATELASGELEGGAVIGLDEAGALTATGAEAGSGVGGAG